MNYKKEKTKDAQILVITLFILMILAIVVVGVVIVTNRDTGQIVSNQKYEQFLNIAETELQRVIKKYGQKDVVLGNLALDSDYSSVIDSCTAIDNSSAGELGYECIMTPDDTLDLELNAKLKVIERKDIIGLQVAKDETVTINLSGYNNILSIDWDKNVAVEFFVDFFVDSNANGTWEDTEEILQVSDIYDYYNVFDTTDPSNTFGFQVLNAGSPGRGVRLNINNISGLPANYLTRSLSITPRSDANIPPVVFNIIPSNKNSFPFQVRFFETSVYDPSDDRTPIVSVESQISLTTQQDSIFNYSLITDGEITL